KVRLSDDDVERERSIVVEEWRQGRGCAQRATEDFFKLVVKGSLFEERLPIGLMSVIRTVPPETVRAFYARHYHPERMAVVAVGDFEDGGKGVVELVKGVFEGCPRGDTKEAPPVGVPSHYDVRAAVFADSEATSSSMVLEPALPLKTHDHYRREVTEDLFHACLNARLSKTAMRDRPPFLTASSSTPVTVAALSTVQLMVTALDGALPRAMRAVLTEVHRIKVHGFSDREVSIAKKNHLAEIRGEWVARDQTDSNNLCSDYVEHFLRHNPAPGIGWEAGVLAPLLETVGTGDVNEVAERFSWGKNTVVFATCPTPGRLACLQNWLLETLPQSLSSVAAASPFRGSFLGSVLPFLEGKKRIRFGGDSPARGGEGAMATLPAAGGGTGGVPTKEELLEVIGRFEERGGGGGVGRGRMGSWERVREWSHDRWGEPLEVEDLLPDYLTVGDRPAEPAAGWSPVKVLGPGDGEIQVHEIILPNGMQVRQDRRK
ncbi:unnamed protein product, partial [Ectocarpus sp. 13 AM-2016]